MALRAVDVVGRVVAHDVAIIRAWPWGGGEPSAAAPSIKRDLPPLALALIMSPTYDKVWDLVIFFISLMRAVSVTNVSSDGDTDINLFPRGSQIVKRRVFSIKKSATQAPPVQNTIGSPSQKCFMRFWEGCLRVGSIRTRVVLRRRGRSAKSATGGLCAGTYSTRLRRTICLVIVFNVWRAS